MRRVAGRTLRLAAGTLLAMAVPALAVAADGDGGGRAVYDLIMRLINFAILAGIIIYFARKPVVNAVKNSIESVRTVLLEAEKTSKAAEARMKQAEDKLAGLDREVGELLDHARQEGEAERERILAEAEQAVEKLKKEAVLAIEQELKKYQDVLRKDAAEAAVALAEEILREKVTAEDQRKFIADYLEKLEANT